VKNRRNLNEKLNSGVLFGFSSKQNSAGLLFLEMTKSDKTKHKFTQSFKTSVLPLLTRVSHT
jgi:hypothetical protein